LEALDGRECKGEAYRGREYTIRSRTDPAVIR
jgi:hypothetical protein